MSAATAWRLGPREDSPRPAPPPEKLPPREPVTPVKLRQTLRRVFGLQALRPGQAEVIERVLAGQNTLAVMPTGAGKSLCYQLPAVLRDSLTVVISPLIALMKDQCDTLQARGIAARQLHSGVDANTRLETEALLTRGAVRVLFTTPERLADPRTLGLLQEQRVGLLVVDEAHCITQWGHDFRPAFSALRDARRALGRPPVLALTATAPVAVQREIAEALAIPREGVLCHGVYRPTLQLAVELPQTEAARRELIGQRLMACEGSAIVYCATVREATALQRELSALSGLAGGVGLYHGKLPARDREAAQEAFMRGECRVMVATNAFGMGIDKPDIRLVLHAQMPASIEAYVQESGRAGRDGEPAEALLLFREGDRALQQFFAGGQPPSREELAAVWQALSSQTPQGGWLPAALAEMVRLPQRRLERVLVALRSARALRGNEATGLKPAAPAARRAPQAVVSAAEAMAQQRRDSDRDGLAAMVLYAKAGGCRWATVLAHFGEALDNGADRCGHCDSCARFTRLLAAERAQGRPAPAVHPEAVAARPARFEAGQRVRVRRFGWGEVKACSDEQVRIDFPRHGLRDIHPDFVLAPR
ncbi:RecQ family ATP-dependent DNA helicase [Roseateles puraquae]|uniref:ATP-dependent DNA helicase RecQ n=1 Tax=Roseateles puraquae TaxID=431059 RepID=A0A254N8E5_9BURK|nr:RecQ family ATP-dependent DNA helicase [Roseateles puraquae]MDG0856264.1 RecQ family ATP-dependent DNA helicase [Roseateles puraquae]OWR03082.1 recombinase RecQ [Roseateles puraquae]